MTKSELQEQFRKLTAQAKNVSETNDEYKAGLLADIEADAEGTKLDRQQQVGLEKMMEECDARAKSNK